MSDPVFTATDFLRAHDVVRSISEDMAIEFQINGTSWTRDQMQKHVNERGALIYVANRLLDEGERLLKPPTE